MTRRPGESLREPGDIPVTAPVVCVISRFGLRSVFGIVATYLDYRRVTREAASEPGFLHSAFLISGPRTCYSISLWANEAATNVVASATPGLPNVTGLFAGT